MAIGSANPYPHFRIESKDSTKPGRSPVIDRKIQEIFFEIKAAVVAQRVGVSSVGSSSSTVTPDIVKQYSFVIDFDQPESCVLKKRATGETENIDLTKAPYKEIFDTSYKTHRGAQKALPTQVTPVAPKASSPPPVASTPSAIASKVTTAVTRLFSPVLVTPLSNPIVSVPISSLDSNFPAASAIDISKIPPSDLADEPDDYFRGLDAASVSKLTKDQLLLIRDPVLALIRDKLTEGQKNLPAVKFKLQSIDASGAKLKPKDLTIKAIAHLDGEQICTDISAKELGKLDQSIIQKMQNVNLFILNNEQISAILLKLTPQQITHLLNTKDADFLSKIGIDHLDKTFIHQIPQGTLNQLSDEVLKSIKSKLSFSQKMNLPIQKRKKIGVEVTTVSPSSSRRLDAGVVVPSSVSTFFRPSSAESTLAQRALTAPRNRLVSQSPKKTFWDRAKSKWENLKTKFPWRKTSEATSVAVTQANPAWHRPTHQRKEAVEDGVQLQDREAPRPISTATSLTSARISRINPLVSVQRSKASTAITRMSVASSAEAVAKATKTVRAGWPSVARGPVEEFSTISPLMGRTIPLSPPAPISVTPVSELDEPISPVSLRSPTSGRIRTPDYISKLESGNIQVIGVDQIKSIPEGRLINLSEDYVQKFTKAQLEAMTETQREAIKDNLSAKQRGWLGYTPVDIQASVLRTTERKSVFSPIPAGGTIWASRSDSIEQLTPDLISSVDQKTVQSLTEGNLKRMTKEQLTVLKRTKDSVLSQNQKSIIDALIASKSKP